MSKTKSLSLRIVLALAIAVFAYFIWDRKENSDHPYRALKSGVWRLTSFEAVRDQRGTYFGSNLDAVFFKFSDQSIRMYFYSGKTGDDGIVDYEKMRKNSESTLRVLSVREFPSEVDPRVVIQTEKLTCTLVHKKREKHFEIYWGELSGGRLYQDEAYSTYPETL